MTLRKLAGVAVMTVALTGCDKIPAWVPFIGNKEPPPAAPVARTIAPVADTTPKARRPLHHASRRWTSHGRRATPAPSPRE
ncbi:MAG: hypothetical protein EXR93_07635 [Gemmatimonadetes bacterium]|nr:hypothetical protein [Gemmatimonadota bacterium]